MVSSADKYSLKPLASSALEACSDHVCEGSAFVGAASVVNAILLLNFQ